MAVDTAYAANSTVTIRDCSMQIFPVQSVSGKKNQFSKVYGSTTDLKKFLNSQANFKKAVGNADGLTFKVLNNTLGKVDAKGQYIPLDGSVNKTVRTNTVTYTKTANGKTYTGKIKVASRQPIFMLMNPTAELDFANIFLSNKHKAVKNTLKFSVNDANKDNIHKAKLRKGIFQPYKDGLYYIDVQDQSGTLLERLCVKVVKWVSSGGAHVIALKDGTYVDDQKLNHTAEGYARAVEQGAWGVATGLYVTKDGKLVVAPKSEVTVLGNEKTSKIHLMDFTEIQAGYNPQVMLLDDFLKITAKNSAVPIFTVSATSNISDQQVAIRIISAFKNAYKGKQNTSLIFNASNPSTSSKNKEITLAFNRLYHAAVDKKVYGRVRFIVPQYMTNNGLVDKLAKDRTNDQAPAAATSISKLESGVLPSSSLPLKGYSMRGRTLTPTYKVSKINSGNKTMTSQSVSTSKQVTVSFAGDTAKAKVKFDKHLKDADIAPMPARYADSYHEVTPNPTVRSNGELLVKDTDYTITYKNNKEPGTARALLKGIGKYTGTRSLEFRLVNIGDDLARTACELSYSRPTAFKGGKSSWVSGKKGTTRYLKAHEKVVNDGNVKIPQGHKGDPQYCSVGICVIVQASGYDNHFPMRFFGQNFYLMKDHGKDTTADNEAYKNTKPGDERHGWLCVSAPSDYDNMIHAPKDNKDKNLNLQPGDIIKDRAGHIFMYVGKKIPTEVYNDKIKGTDGDLGAPGKDYAFVSAHGGWWDGGFAASALSLGTSDYAGAHRKKMRVFRCTRSQDGIHQVGNVVPEQ